MTLTTHCSTAGSGRAEDGGGNRLLVVAQLLFLVLKYSKRKRSHCVYLPHTWFYFLLDSRAFHLENDVDLSNNDPATSRALKQRGNRAGDNRPSLAAVHTAATPEENTRTSPPSTNKHEHLSCSMPDLKLQNIAAPSSLTQPTKHARPAHLGAVSAGRQAQLDACRASHRPRLVTPGC